MELDRDACYRALRTRDARFDGHFFTAVRTTGIYCRPVCPARTPKRENCRFFPSAAAAQDSGFRPCLRCRPEASPGTPAWRGTSATVTRALRLIEQGALDETSVGTLAERLGVGERHLRRLFLRHVGAPPVAVARTRRLLFAKSLIDETRLPMAEVAFASGYSSIRRFNEAVRESWNTTPSRLRRADTARGDRCRSRTREASSSPDLALRLPFRPPLDWPGLCEFLSARAIPGVEVVAREHYRRSIRVGAAVGVVEVRSVPDQNQLVARLQLSGRAPLIGVAERLRRLFDLSADPLEISAQLERDPILRQRVRARPGLRVPGAWDGFELAVRAILGQQVSVGGATTLAGRLVNIYGTKLPAEFSLSDSDVGLGAENARPAVASLFPTAETLTDIDPAAVGLTRARARAISALASGVVSGAVDLESSRGLEESVESLCSLPGIGQWTAHYIAMRALREPDAWPASDLGLRRALGGPEGPASAHETQTRSQAWRPWRAYAALHLWTTSAQRPFRNRDPARGRSTGDG